MGKYLVVLKSNDTEFPHWIVPHDKNHSNLVTPIGKIFLEFLFRKKFENLFVRNGTELSVGINIRPSILDLEEEIAHHVKYQTCHFFRNSNFSILFFKFFEHKESAKDMFFNDEISSCGQFYDPIRTINHFGQSDFGYYVILDSTFLRSAYFTIHCHYYSTFLSFEDWKSQYFDFFRRPAELSPTELINKIIKIPKHIPDYDKSEFRSRQHVMTVPHISNRLRLHVKRIFFYQFFSRAAGYHR